jgi:hypothetical protein
LSDFLLEPHWFLAHSRLGGTKIIDLPTGMPAVFANPDAYKPGTPHFKKR